MLLQPSTLGAMAALPPAGSDFYRWMLTYFVVLFSATYAWLALAPTISRQIIALSAIGRAGAFLIALLCALRADIELMAFLVSAGGLAFAIYFFYWLRATAASAAKT